MTDCCPGQNVGAFPTLWRAIGETRKNQSLNIPLEIGAAKFISTTAL